MNYSRFRKPSRYIGNEVNMSRKEGKVKVALCFPDTYEIGMSHLGLKILYRIINDIPETSAERVFAPWTDLEEYLREHRLPLTSLEQKRPLKDFDIVGFTLQYELSYTNILNMLDLGNMPVRAADRGDELPLVIAGGPCTVNPAPLAPFIDAFVIGDAEEAIKEILDVYDSTATRGGKLEALSEIAGVYVPSIHDRGDQRIKRRIVSDLEHAEYPEDMVLPYTTVVHDRVAVEISRGCTRGCRFCQAGIIYRPVRERSPGRVIELSEKALSQTGYEDVSFTSLSTGDYSGLLPLIGTFNKMCAGDHISTSLPSIRVGAISRDLLREVKSVRKTGFTIAPEAGTERLRAVINKDFTDEDFEEALHLLFSEGWTTIKLYFMVGLPTETMEDIDGLIDMAYRAARTGRQVTGKRVNINVGISAFVPKPHTPFQWEGQNSYKELREKQDYIRRAFRKGKINFKGQYVENSLMEAVFSRGDRQSASLLEHAWKLGCRFDGWTEFFDFNKWSEAADKAGIDLYAYASRSYGVDAELPWERIDTGVHKKWLQTEYRKALSGTTTPDCIDSCSGCGLECGEDIRGRALYGDTEKELPDRRGRVNTNIDVPARMRIGFSKTGDMRYLSHQELMTAFIRALRRAEIPVAYSTGFHPHPKLSFGPPLATGVEGTGELFDLEVSSPVDIKEFPERLNAVLPEGLTILSAAYKKAGGKSLNDMFSCYEYEIEIGENLKEKIDSFMRLENCQVQRKKKKVDIRPMVHGAEIKAGTLFLRISDTDSAKARLAEILQEMLGIDSIGVQTLMIKRVGLYGNNCIKLPY